jgi:hypothetical protein
LFEALGTEAIFHVGVVLVTLLVLSVGELTTGEEPEELLDEPEASFARDKAFLTAFSISSKP